MNISPPFIETVFLLIIKKESLYFCCLPQLVFDVILGPQTVLLNEYDQCFRFKRNLCCFNKTSPGDLWPPTSAIWLSHWLHHINPTEHERGAYEQNEWPGIKSWWVKRLSSLYVIAHFAKLRSLRSIFCWYELKQTARWILLLELIVWKSSGICLFPHLLRLSLRDTTNTFQRGRKTCGDARKTSAEGTCMLLMRAQSYIMDPRRHSG